MVLRTLGGVNIIRRVGVSKDKLMTGEVSKLFLSDFKTKTAVTTKLASLYNCRL